MTDWDSSDIAINGARVHYYRTGGDLPKVVLAHGLTDSALCWRRVARALAPSYDVVFYDARGHGLSDAPRTGYTPTERAADLGSLIEALELAPVRLIGHSLGAEAVLWVLTQKPELVACAVLEDPAWRKDWADTSPEERAAMQASWRASLGEHQSHSREELIAFCRVRSPEWSEEDCGDWANSKLAASPMAVTSVGAARPRWQSLVSRIARPTLLITGDPTRGALVTPEVAREAAALSDRIELLYLAGAGHNLRRDRFTPYIEGVLGFLGRSTPSPG